MKRTQKTIANIILIFSTVIFVADVLFAPGSFRGGDMMSDAIMIRTATKFMMALIVKDVVDAKYIDKARRNTK